MTKKEMRLERMAKHLEWLHKENKEKWDGAMFALDVMGYIVDVDENDHYVITEA